MRGKKIGYILPNEEFKIFFFFQKYLSLPFFSQVSRKLDPDFPLRGTSATAIVVNKVDRWFSDIDGAGVGGS